MEAFLRNTDTELGETSADGNFTVVEAECLAGCGFPTCVQINSEYFENVATKDVPQILEHLRNQAPGGGSAAASGSEDTPSAATEGEE